MLANLTTKLKNSTTHYREKPARLTPVGAPADGFQPLALFDVELSQPLPVLEGFNSETKQHYQRARLTVRLHSFPIGMIDVEFSNDILSPVEYTGKIWEALESKINEHLREDQLEQAIELNSNGLTDLQTPSCLKRRAEILANAPFISIVVSTRDRAEHLRITLPVFLKLEYPRYEIIVVDNASSTSATADLLKTEFAQYTQVRYVREDRPGLSWGRNCGLKHARGEIVAFIDDDELPDRHWLAALVSGFQVTDNVSCVTGLILPAEIETPAQYWLEEFGGFSKGSGFNRGIYNLTTHRPKEPLFPYLASKFGSGGNMAFKTSVLRQIGGFDNALGAGTPAGAAEEFDAFFKVIQRGETLVSQPEAIVRHIHRREFNGLRQQLYGYGLGFTAYITKCLMDNPLRLLYFLSQSLYIFYYLFNSKSKRNKHKSGSYPKELTNRELKGMLYGPIAYLRSRQHLRKVVKRFGVLDLT